MHTNSSIQAKALQQLFLLFIKQIPLAKFTKAMCNLETVRCCKQSLFRHRLLKFGDSAFGNKASRKKAPDPSCGQAQYAHVRQHWTMDRLPQGRLSAMTASHTAPL